MHLKYLQFKPEFIEKRKPNMKEVEKQSIFSSGPGPEDEYGPDVIWHFLLQETVGCDFGYIRNSLC